MDLYHKHPNWPKLLVQVVILALTGPELLHKQASDWQTDAHICTQTQAVTIPAGQNWPRVGHGNAIIDQLLFVCELL